MEDIPLKFHATAQLEVLAAVRMWLPLVKKRHNGVDSKHTLSFGMAWQSHLHAHACNQLPDLKWHANSTQTTTCISCCQSGLPTADAPVA